MSAGKDGAGTSSGTCKKIGWREGMASAASPLISQLGRKVAEIARVSQLLPVVMRFRKSKARDALCCSRWERDFASVFSFVAHFTARDNNEKRVTEGRSFSAL